MSIRENAQVLDLHLAGDPRPGLQGIGRQIEADPARQALQRHLVEEDQQVDARRTGPTATGPPRPDLAPARGTVAVTTRLSSTGVTHAPRAVQAPAAVSTGSRRHSPDRPGRRGPGRPRRPPRRGEMSSRLPSTHPRRQAGTAGNRQGHGLQVHLSSCEAGPRPVPPRVDCFETQDSGLARSRRGKAALAERQRDLSPLVDVPVPLAHSGEGPAGRRGRADRNPRCPPRRRPGAPKPVPADAGAAAPGPGSAPSAARFPARSIQPSPSSTRAAGTARPASPLTLRPVESPTT